MTELEEQTILLIATYSLLETALINLFMKKPTGHDVTENRSSEFPRKQAPEFTSPPKPITHEKIKKELQMPEHAPDMRQLFAYFCKTRKIPAATAEEMVHNKLLYQFRFIQRGELMD